MGYLLILGAKSDMAKATARRYAEQGYDLLLAGRELGELDAFVSDLKIRYSRDVKCIDFDVLAYDTHQTIYDALADKPIGVIAFVGYLGNHNLAKTDFSEAQKIIDTNYTGLVSMLNVVANDFETRQSGFIVGVSSVAGERGRQSNYYYGSAKAAFTAYLSGLRNRLLQSNVHVLTVKPGFVATKMTEGLDLPAKLTASPQQVAKDIYRAQHKKKNVLYTLWLWRWIMLIIKNIPEGIFKKLKM